MLTPLGDTVNSREITRKSLNASIQDSGPKPIAMVTLSDIARGLTAPEGTRNIAKYGADEYHDFTLKRRPTEGPKYKQYQEELKSKRASLNIIYTEIARHLALPGNTDGLWKLNTLVVKYVGLSQKDRTLSISPCGLDSLYLEANGESESVKITMEHLKAKMELFQTAESNVSDDS